FNSEGDALGGDFDRTIKSLSTPACYFIESDAGLFMTGSEEYGALFVFWDARQLADQMCRIYEGPLQQRVSKVEIPELHDQLIACRDAGVGYVLMNRAPDGSGRIVPIDEAIEFYGNVAGRSGALQSCIDPSDRLLDQKQQSGTVPGRPLGPSAKTDPSGCLVLVAIVGALGLFVAWTC